MSDPSMSDRVLGVLARIAPEARHLAIRPGAGLRDQLDLDSMDFMNFVIGLHREFHVDIPETEYKQLATLDGAIAYIAGRQAGGSR